MKTEEKVIRFHFHKWSAWKLDGCMLQYKRCVVCNKRKTTLA